MISRYGCAPSTNEGGPELVYTIEAPVAGVIAARLSNLPAGVDVDVHILVGDTCVSRGHWVASARVPAGRHRIIVDSWVDSAGRARAGAFDLEVGYTRPTDLTEAGLTAVAADRALTAFGEAFAQGATERLVYTIVDLDQPSDTPRLVTYDLLHQQVLVRTEAGHGAGSTVDGAPARVVSAGEGLQRSPVGLLLTAERSPGRIRLDGIEPTFNTDARARGLALAADPDAPRLTEGDLGVPPAALARIAEAVGDGSLVMVHFSDPTWTENSDYVAP